MNSNVQTIALTSFKTLKICTLPLREALPTVHKFIFLARTINAVKRVRADFTVSCIFRGLYGSEGIGSTRAQGGYVGRVHS